jgi:D-alanyl-D-alanine dipeptidase
MLKIIVQLLMILHLNLKDYSLDFVYDMKYATTDNFLKAKVYDCEACFYDLKR